MKRLRYLTYLISIIIILILGISFSWFQYNRTGDKQTLVVGNIYLKLNNGNDTISLTNVFPETIEEARSKNDNYIDFTLKGLNTSKKSIYYEIYLNHGDDIENYERFKDNELKFDLSEITIENEEEKERYLLEAVSYENLVKQKIWVDTIASNIEEEIERTYRLRMWIDGNVLISDTDPNANYTAHSGINDYNKHYATIKVGVIGDFEEKKIGTPYQLAKVDYDKGGALLYTGASRDSLEGFGHQPIYYYTSGENANVLFNDTCWQMIRTTDTGGVKMIYNGEAEEKQVFDSYETLTDTDIIYTNDVNYPYTYSDGKWTSGAVPNGNNKVGIIDFQVKENGYYTIDYDISTREGSHYIYVYVNNIEVRRDSGITKGSVRLGNLNTNNQIRISYVKNVQVPGNCDDVINFQILKGEGESTKVKSCDIGRQNGIGLSGSAAVLNLNDYEYYYADSYTYNGNGFTLSSDATLARWSDSTYEDLLGKYVCSNRSVTCTELHYVQTYNSNRQAGTSKYVISSRRNYSEIGVSDFNEHYTSLSSVGYMYNNMYEYKTKIYTQEAILGAYNFISTHYYGEGSFNGSRYTLTTSSLPANAAATKNKYTLANSNSAATSTSMRYIVGVSGSTLYYINMTDEGTHDLAYFNTAYTYGASIQEENGKYRINSATTIHKTDWFTGYSAVSGKYLCVGGVDENNLCNKENLRYVTATTNTYMRYFMVDTSWRFGSDVTYSNGKYTLTGTTQDIKDWPHNYNNTITNTHYTCFNEESSNECGDKVYYVHLVDSTNIRYIELSAGKKYDDALYEMINYKGSNTNKADAEINKYDSAIKQMIDHWYEHTELTSKTNYFEDVVYCNDRTILNNDLRNWAPNGTVTNSWTLYFKMYSTNANTNTFTCTNVTDSFTTNNSKAKLKYPIGLLTESERSKMGNSYAKTGHNWWLASPSGVSGDYAYALTAGSAGGAGNNAVNYAYGVRPVVSLGPDTKVVSGDGSYDNPFLIE